MLQSKIFRLSKFAVEIDIFPIFQARCWHWSSLDFFENVDLYGIYFYFTESQFLTVFIEIIFEWFDHVMDNAFYCE